MSTIFRKATVGTGSFTLPQRYYTDPDVFRLELDRIFSNQWLCIGRSAEIPSAGAYKLVTIAGENLIVVRDQDGVVHAHYNVCRHRGTRMCMEERGTLASSILCPYHAWTYGLDGQLLNARHMNEVPDFDKDQYGLHSAHIVEWDGFLMLNLAQNPEPFEIAYAPLINKFNQWRVSELVVAQTITYDVRANWKMIVENYSECYHCPLIHPALVELSHWQSGRNDLSEGPFLGGYMTLNHSGGSMTMDGNTARPAIRDLDAVERDRVYYYSFFPNMLLSLHADYVMVHTITPLAADRSLIECSWMFEPEVMAQEGFDPADAVGFWDMTNRQDWDVCEWTQMGVSSRAYTPGPYAQQEGLLWTFDQYYLQTLEG